MKYIDLRSDTVTWPTEAMREAMAHAQVGDDVYGDDPTVIELEQYAASITAKEAALFVPSGVFGNQLALFTHSARGTEVILDDQSHIVQHESGASAIIAGVQLRTADMHGQCLSPEAIEQRIRIGDDIHEPKTSLICLENAHSNGKVFSVQEMENVRRCANRRHIPIHLDGARLFNAAISLGVEAKEITQHTDSVMFCLSKGLCAPVGSILAGSRKFIDQARRNRKIMGGGLRQSGVLAAAGLVALKEMRYRLDTDHQNAGLLEKMLEEIDKIEIAHDRRDINFVFFKNKDDAQLDAEAFVEYMQQKNILINPCGQDGYFRFVTHYWITKEHIKFIADTVKEFYA
ncbi:MAG: low-specificity L-threonine aldolase [Treponema sp.]